MVRVYESLALVVNLRGAFLNELVKLYHHAVAAHLYGTQSGCRAAGYHVHSRALYYELYSRRRCVCSVYKIERCVSVIFLFSYCMIFVGTVTNVDK